MKNETILYALDLLENHHEELLFLDTETTGLSDSDQVIELGIVDIHGNVLMDQRFMPSVPINPKAQEVHGISMEDLCDMPFFRWRLTELCDKLYKSKLIIFNKKYDIRMIDQSNDGSVGGFEPDKFWLRVSSIHCAMKMAANVFGSTNKFGSISLSSAAAAAGLNVSDYKAHSAIGDCLMTRDLFIKIAEMKAD